MTPEGKVKERLKQRVKQAGGHLRFAQWVARKGAPDCYVMTGIGCFWVETKSPKGKLSPIQSREIALMRSFGIPVNVFWSAEQVDEFFNNLENDS